MKIKKEQTHQNFPCQARGSASLKAAGLPVKRTMKNQITTLTVASVTSLQAINIGESGGKRIPPRLLVAMHIGKPVEWTVSECLKIYYQERRGLGSDIPTSGTRSQEIHHSKRHMSPD